MLVNNIKMEIRGIEWGGMDWNCMVQHMGKWKTHVNTVINHQIHKMQGSS
jgi:hypothetical protein